jgi:hypothetical protein
MSYRLSRPFSAAPWPAPRRARLPRTTLLLALGAAGMVGAVRAAPESPQIFHRLEIEIRDPGGAPLQGRVRVLGSDGDVYPGVPDTSRLSFWGAGGYWYIEGTGWIDVPAGTTRVTAGRGFEWRPADRTLQVVSDTTITMTLSRFVDLGPEGWFGGDLHTHSNHPPLDYPITPEISLRVARAEGLNVMQLLDQGSQFTGTPHAISDSVTKLYYAYEHRNQAYGHALFTALRTHISPGCCLDPAPAFPMLTDLHNMYVPSAASAMVLAHPHSTDDYFYDDGWPGAGLGRELPVLAAFGALDVLEVASYGNNPYEDLSEWFDVLSAGVNTIPGAGTDARLCSTSSMPVGSWRIYAQTEPGMPLDYDAWVDAVRAGRTFLTNYPLIPEFKVADVASGGTIEVPGDTLLAPVHLRASCALGLQRVSILAEGQEVWSANFTGQVPPVFSVDTTFTIETPTPAWLVARLDGVTGHPHAFHGVTRAITNAVRVTHEGAPIRRTAPSARWLDKLGQLEQFVTIRGNWVSLADRDTVMARIQKARAFYNDAFVLPPNPFALISPAEGDTARSGELAFDWEDATDPEEGDRLRYVLRVSADSTLANPYIYIVQNSQFGNIPLLPGREYFWAVDAQDRNGNTTRGTPPISRFFLRDGTTAVESPPPAVTAQIKPRGAPNPSRGWVLLMGLSEPIAIFDVGGRRIAESGSGVVRRGEDVYWDGGAHGHAAPPGLYWARGAKQAGAVQLIRVP